MSKKQNNQSKNNNKSTSGFNSLNPDNVKNLPVFPKGTLIENPLEVSTSDLANNYFIPEQFDKTGTSKNWNPTSLPVELEAQAAKDQHWFSTLINAGAGFSQGSQGAFAQGAATTLHMFRMAHNSLLGDYSKNKTQNASDLSIYQWGENKLDRSQYNNIIHTNPEESWYSFQNLSNSTMGLGYTAGLAVEAITEQAAMSLINLMTGGGGGAGIMAQASSGASKLGKIGTGLMKMFNSPVTKQAFIGTFKGAGNAFLNSEATRNEVFEEALESGYSVDQATTIADNAARVNFNTEFLPNMLINGLQYAATFGRSGKTLRGVRVGSGVEGALETPLEFLTGKINNKTLRSLANLGVNMTIEGITEGGEFLAAEYGKSKAFGRDFEIDGGELASNVFEGAFGGAVFGLGGKGLNKITNKFRKNDFEKTYEKAIKNSTTNIFSSFKEEQKANQEVQKRLAEFEKSPTESNAKALAISMSKARSAASRNQAEIILQAIHLDYLKGNDAIFDNNINQMQLALEAVRSKDQESLFALGLVDEQGNEIVEGSLQQIENTYYKNIEDARKIKSLIEENLENTTNDFEIAYETAKNRFLLDEAMLASNTTQSELSQVLDKDRAYNQLSEEGKERFMLETEQKALKGMKSISDRNQDRLAEVNDRLNTLSPYSTKDSNLLAGINTNKINPLVAEGINYNETIDDINREYVDITNPKHVKRKVAERRKRDVEEAAKNATKKNKESIKKRLRKKFNKDKLSPEEEAKIDGAAIANDTADKENRVISEVLDETGLSLEDFGEDKTKKKEFTPFPDMDEKKRKHMEEQKGKKAMTPEEAMAMYPANFTPEENDSFDLQPKTNLPAQPNETISNAYARMIKGLADKYAEDGDPLTEKEMYHLMRKMVGTGTLYSNFNEFKEGFKRSGVPYNEEALDGHFNSLHKEAEDVAKGLVESGEMTSAEIKKVPTTKREWIDSKQGSHVIPTEDDYVYDGPKVTKPVLKLSFLGVNYELIEETDPDGMVLSVSKLEEDDLNRDGAVDLNVVLDPNKLLPGEQIEISFDENWESPQGHPKGSPAWIASVPMIGTYKGRVLGPILHDVNWWNEENVADFSYNKALSKAQQLERQQQVIKEAREQHIKMRTAIFNNKGGKITITSKELGFQTNNNKLESIADNVPNAEISYMEFDGKGSPLIKLPNGKILPSESIVNPIHFTKDGKYTRIAHGATVIVKQVGTDKEGNPTYVVYPVLDAANEAQAKLEEWNNSFLILKDAIYTVQYDKPRGKVPSVQKAHEILEEAAEAMGMSKGEFLSKNAIPRLSDRYPKPSERVSGKLRGAYHYNSRQAKVAIISPDLQVTSRSYMDLLKETLHTQHKFYEITKEDGTKDYVLYPQPRIEFELDGVDVKGENEFKPLEDKKEEVKEGEKEKEEVKEKEEEIILGSKETITEITTSQETLIVDEFVNFSFRDIYQWLIDNPNGVLTDKVVVDLVVKSFNNHLENKMVDTPAGSKPFKEVYPKEYEYVKENADNLLGLFKREDGSYQIVQNNYNSIIKAVEGLINKELEEIIDTTGVNEKTHDRASYEVNVKQTLSLKAKLMVAGKSVVPPNKSMREAFGGFREFTPIDSVYDMLQQVFANTDNSMAAIETRIKTYIGLNKEEFGYLQGVLDTLKEAPPHIQNELLYRFNQTKVQMFFSLYSKTKEGEWKLQSYNSNSKDPKIQVLDHYKTNFKHESPLVKYGKKGYRFNTDLAEELLEIYETWEKEGSLDNVSSVELANWLNNFGIDATPVTVEKYKEAKSDKTNFKPGRSLHSQLYKNLKDVVREQKNREDSNKDKDYHFPTSGKDMIFNGGTILDYRNEGHLSKFIDIEIEMNFHALRSMYIAGKSINSYAQPTHATLQVDKLRDVNDTSGEKEKLKSAAFPRNNMLLNLLIENHRIRESLAISLVSLQPLKERGKPNKPNPAGITQQYEGDREAALFAHFATTDAIYTDQTYENFELRGVKMSSPALSDSSQSYLLHTVAVDLRKGSFEMGEDGNFVIGDRIADLIFSQAILPDIERMVEFLRYNKSTGVKGQDVSSQMFTIFPMLNSLSKNGVSLLESLHKEAKEGGVIEDVINNFKEDINAIIKDYFKKNVESKIKKDDNGITGKWKEYGFVKVDDNTGEVSLEILDSKYLKTKEGDNNFETAQLAAYDYAINYFLAQSQWQALFAGDYTNYFKDTDIFEVGENGVPNIFKLNPKSKKFKALADRATEIGYENMLGEVFNNMEEGARDNLAKRLKELISPGNRLPKDVVSQKYLQLMISDVEVPATTLGHLVDLYYSPTQEQKDSIIELHEKVREREEAEYDLDNTAVEELSKEIETITSKLKEDFPLVADYIEVTNTDAQEYTTWKEHLDILFGQGSITEEEYENLKVKLTNQSNDGVNDSNRLTKEEKRVVFQPIKPLHAGLYYEGDENFTNQKFVYVKTSSFPLLPESSVGQLDGVRRNMEKLEKEYSMPVRASYQSGNKVGAIKDAISFSRLSNTETSLEELTNSKIELDRANFSIQQDKPYKTASNIQAGKRDDVNVGTQMEDIILGNGINKIEKQIFPNNFDGHILEQLGITPSEDNKISGVDLDKIYKHLYEESNSLAKKRLFIELGLNVDGTWDNSITSMEAIQKLLKRQATNRQDKEILDSLVYYVLTTDGEGKTSYKEYTKEQLDTENEEKRKSGETELTPVKADFRLPLWMGPNSQKFESILNSIIESRIIDRKQPGFSSPVGSSQGLKSKPIIDTIENHTDKGIIFSEKYDPIKGLQATTITTKDGKKVLQKAQVVVASKYRGADGKLLDLPTKTVDGKILLDLDKIDEELLSFFSYRIPTSSHQSGVVIEIVGFLPEEHGDLMLVPSEHTVQIGEDYDIDTRYVYGYNTFVDANGDLKILNYDNLDIDIDENLDLLYGKFQEYKDELYEDYAKLNSSIWDRNKEAIIELALLKEEEAKILGGSYTEGDKLLNELFGYTANLSEIQDEIRAIEDSILPNTEVIEVHKAFNKERDTMISFLRQAFKEEKKEMFNAYVKHKHSAKLKEKIIENNLTHLYKSVYTTTNKDVQKSISATLSTELANRTAGIIDKVNKSIEFQTIYDDRYQSKVMSDGSSGKLGIGVHSNWVVLNSLLQQSEETIRLDIDRMVFGNLYTDGVLGDTSVDRNGFTVAQLNMINQNVSTDNLKLGIMGKRNENKYTINALAMLTNMKILTDTLEDGTVVGYADFFISQPIIKRYVELRAKYESETNREFVDNINEKIDEDLIKEFGAGVPWMLDSSGSMLVGKMEGETFNRESVELNAVKLNKNLTSPSNKTQWAVYQKFKQLNSLSVGIGKIQKILNVEGQGTGISFFDSINKKREIAKFIIANNMQDFNGELERKVLEDYYDGDIEAMYEDLKNYDVSFKSLIGPSKIVTTQQEAIDLEQQGYQRVETLGDGMLYAKPETVVGIKLINSTVLNNNLWTNVFPFEQTAIVDQIKAVYRISGINPNTIKGRELEYKVLSNIKDFYYSVKGKENTLFEKSIEEERRALFLNDGVNIPLANYLHKLKNSKPKHPMFREAFFRDLGFNLGLDGEPSTIEFSLNEKSNFNRNEAFRVLEVMSKDNRPIEEGFAYTYADLVKDLTKYALLANQEGGAVGFRQYIPMEILNKYGVTDSLRSFTNQGSSVLQNKLLNGLYKNLRNSNVNIEGDTFSAHPRDMATFMSNINQINAKYGEDTVKIHIDPEATSDSITGTLVFGSNLSKLDESVFLKQFIQHNIEYAKRVYISRKNSKEWIIEGEYLKTTSNESSEFINVGKQGSTDRVLYQKVSEGVYKAIDTLGTTGVNEYSAFDYDVKSLFTKNNAQPFTAPNPTTNNKAVVPAVNTQGSTVSIKEEIEKKGITSVLESIPETSKSYPIVQMLKPFFQDIKTNFITTDIANGVYVPKSGNSIHLHHPILGDLERGTIYLEEKFLETATREELIYAMAEEVLHSMTSDEVKKYIDTRQVTFDVNGNITIPDTAWKTIPGTNNTYDAITAPRYIGKLLALYKQAGKHFIDNLKETGVNKEQKVSQINNERTLGGTTINRLINLEEFIIGVTLDPDFREQMSRVEFKDSNFLTKVLDTIREVFEKVTSTFRIENSITEQGLDAVMDMLSTINRPPNNATTSTTPTTSKTKAETLVEKGNLMTDIEEKGTKVTLDNGKTYTVLGNDIYNEKFQKVYEDPNSNTRKKILSEYNKIVQTPLGQENNYYEGDIKPEPNTVFVFGSNPIGVNGNPAKRTGGAALTALEQFGVKQGEKMDNKMSESGNAFGLTTVTGPGARRSMSAEQIVEGIKVLYETAKANPNKQFKVAYRNTTSASLNGYTGLEMIEMFNAAGEIPSNVIFSKEWADTGKLNIQPQPTPQQNQQDSNTGIDDGTKGEVIMDLQPKINITPTNSEIIDLLLQQGLATKINCN